MADNKNNEGKRYVIKGTPVKDPYTGKPRMVIEEEKHYDGPAGFPIALLALLVCIYSIFRGNIIAIIITGVIAVAAFVHGLMSMAEGNKQHAFGLFLFFLCAALMLAGIVGAVALVFWLITLI